MAIVAQLAANITLTVEQAENPMCVNLTVTNGSSGDIQRVCFNVQGLTQDNVDVVAPEGWDFEPGASQQCASCNPAFGEFDFRLRNPGNTIPAGTSLTFTLCRTDGMNFDPALFAGQEVCVFAPDVPSQLPCICGFFTQQVPPQPIPNNLQAECVRIQKVYDWVADLVSRDDNITVPAECQEAIDQAVEEGRTPLDVTCTPPEVPGTFPLLPKPQPEPEGDAFCVISSNIERRTVNVGGVDIELAIIKAVFRVMPTVTITDSEGDVICEFCPVISLSKKLAVCLPEPLTRDNVLCRITQVTCDENFFEDADPDLGLQLDITVCFEIQVEAEVKLEILAKFCQPRPNDIDITNEITCPTFEFPQQCGPTVFPRQNCDCQAFVNTTGESDTAFGIYNFETSVTNMSTLSASICDNCTLAGSRLSYVFRDLRQLMEDQLNQSFTFTATEFNQPVCTGGDGTLIMTVSGQGRLNFTDASTPDRQVSFILELYENPGTGTDSYILYLYNLGDGQYILTARNDVPDNELTVQDCVRFGENNNGGGAPM